MVEAIVKEIGGGRTGIRLSPVTPANNNADADPQASYNLLAEKLAAHNLAFIMSSRARPAARAISRWAASLRLGGFQSRLSQCWRQGRLDRQ